MNINIFDIDGTLWFPTPSLIQRSTLELGLTAPWKARNAQDFTVCDRVKRAIRKLAAEGEIHCLTNQGGLPHNWEARRNRCNPPKSVAQLLKEWAHLREQLPELGKIYASPGRGTPIYLIGHENGRLEECHRMGQRFQKPSPYLLLAIWHRHPADEYTFWGDMETDKQCAIAAASFGMPVTFRWAKELKG